MYNYILKLSVVPSCMKPWWIAAMLMFDYLYYICSGREQGRTNGRGKGKEQGRKKGRVDWRTVIEGFIILLHGCIQTPIPLPPDRIPVGSDFQNKTSFLGYGDAGGSLGYLYNLSYDHVGLAWWLCSVIYPC